MRKFYLHTIDKSKTFDLNTDSALATEPSGLGNNFALEYKESDAGKYLVNVKPSFDPIKLKIYFNANNTNGYVNYKSLLLFLTGCGTSSFLFEYDDGVTDKYCEVVVKSLPKSEINEDNIFAEEFVFERQTYWYEEVKESFALKNTEKNMPFPLGFSFGFAGKVLQKKYKVSNKFFVNAPISIIISGNIKNKINIYIATLENKIVQQLQLDTNNTDGTIITIEPSNKKILVSKDGVITNGYDLTDKTKQSFLYLPQGEYYIGSNISDDDTGTIEVSIKRYLFD